MKITKYLIGGLAALALVGCKDKMRELNSNPNTIGETDPRYMFLSGTANLDMTRGSIENASQNDAVKMQYFVRYDGAQAGQYCNPTSSSYTSPGTIGNYYDWLYGVGYSMTLLQNYIDNNITDELQRQRYHDLHAIAGIVKVYEAFRVFQNYGAAVYSEAFKAITEGITLPKYDLFSNEVYEALDAELAACIAVLEAPANETTVELGVYDPIFGYTVNSAMGAPEALSNYDVQRTRWKKFANSYRLYMAWIMKAANEAHFSQVLAATQASGLYESAEDGAYAYLNGYTDNNGLYNSDGPSNISMNFSVTDNFITYLKSLDDPRLPLLARANGLYEANTAMQWMECYFPDSLQMHWVFDDATKTWSQKNWGDVLDFEADPLMAYQGQSPNPADKDKSAPQMFWGQRTFTFRFYHPNYNPGDTEGNKTLGPWTVNNSGTVSEDFPATFTVYNPDTSFSIAVACRPQGRYFVAGGGKTFGDNAGASGNNGYDGPVSNSNIFFRQPLYTYPEFCFMMAYLTQNGQATGQSADLWYENGVKAAMEELQGDAIRAGVQVATNTAYTYYNESTGQTITINPKIEGINDNGVYSITDKIANYVSAQSLSNATDKLEAIVGQMWIYSYKQPIKMWDWWRVTGYPKIVDVATPADRPNGLYWVRPYTETSNEQLEWPRRGNLPSAEAANNDNWNAIRDELLTQPNYGATYNQTTGRIFWDKQGL